eukprot:PhM_4_TR7752/c0_g1_i1/m.98258
MDELLARRSDPDLLRKRSQIALAMAKDKVEKENGFAPRGEYSEGWYIPRSGDRKASKTGDGVHYARSVAALQRARFATLDAKIDGELKGTVAPGAGRRARPSRTTHQTEEDHPYAADNVEPKGKYVDPKAVEKRKERMRQALSNQSGGSPA